MITAATAVPLVWLTGGCTLSGQRSDRTDSRSEQAEDDPDVAVLDSATAHVDELVALCEQVVSEQPALTPQVQPLLATHRRHAEVLGSAKAVGAPPRRSPDASGTPTGTATPEPLPGGRTAVLSLVAAAEQRAAQAHLRHVRRAESGQFAQLLASISAAESQHATVLEEVVR